MPVQYSYTSTPPIGCTACKEPQYLYSTAIPLLPLLAVRPVKSLSACSVEIYLYSPYWPYGLYRSSVPVQYSYTYTPPIGRTACTQPQCLYSTAIPLLPLLAVRPVQSLSALQGCTLHSWWLIIYMLSIRQLRKVSTGFSQIRYLSMFLIFLEEFVCGYVYRVFNVL